MSDLVEQKEYKVLARKYRPQRFEDLIGQEILVRILKNAIINNRVAHAYLLTGVRGVGKTTVARLIAMSLNCENRKEEKYEPCGQCDPCISVREDRNLDVIEMDAASKTGVEDIREIIENVKYKAVNNKYKVFIIDEVHMLSRNAFNALLKTLEEPPPHVKFIFATTEVKKIPITIISRCQRFDLLRIEKEVLTTHLSKIAIKEGIKIEKNALALIIRSADGSVRDGLSLLDQAIINCKDQITDKSVNSMLGLADRGKIFDLMENIFKGNIVGALETYNNIYRSGADIIMIFEEMLNVTHFITQMKIAPDLKEDIHIPELERNKGFHMAEKISMSSLGMIWQVLFKGYQELQSGFHLFQHGEMIIIRLIYLYEGPTPDDLIKKIESQKKDLDKLHNNFESSVSEKKNLSTLNQDINTKDETLPIIKIEEENNYSQSNLEIKSFRNFVDLFYLNREAILHTYLYNNAKLISFKEGEVVINAELISDPHFTRSVAKLVSKWTGRIWQVSTSSSNVGQTLYEDDLIKQQKEIKIMKENKHISEILNEFPGVSIHSITDINQTEKENDSVESLKKQKEK